MLKFNLMQNLLNPKFEGYKYNQDFFKVSSFIHTFNPYEFKLNDHFYDFDHLKLISLTNNLYYNHLKQSEFIYYLSNHGEIISLHVNLVVCG